MLRLPVICTVLILVPLVLATAAGAKIIDNPSTVSHLHAEVLKEGNINLVSTGPGSRASSIEVRHTIPQDTERQKSELKQVSGPDGYRLEEDEFGNEIIVLEWDDPPIGKTIYYSMIFDVRVWNRDDPFSGESFSARELTQPNQDITEASYDLAGGLPDMEKFMVLTSYVYDLVDYDKTYQNIQKSAAWVFENKKAVCDGHANLLISMLKAIGYNAYYVIGYAYTEENIDPERPNYWGPHGWVEVEYNGKAISLDPTWLEHPVDATHIKFAAAPDSNYTEYVQIIANNVEVDWGKGDYLVTLLEHEEEPGIEMESRIVNEKPGSGEHSLIITQVKSVGECTLTEINTQSCMDGNRPFFKIEPEERMLGFCGNKTVYWILETPDIKPGVEYICGVNLYGPDVKENLTLSAIRDADNINIRLSTPKVLTPGEFFRVNTTVENKGTLPAELGLFMLLGDYMKEHELVLEAQQAGEVLWTLRAPKTEGRYMMMFMSSSGDMLKEELVVKEKRDIELDYVIIPDNMTLGDSLYINVTVNVLEDTVAEIRVTVDNEEQEMRYVLDKGTNKTMDFIFTPKSDGIKHINIVVLSGEENYQDGVVGNVAVIREHGWLESIVSALRGLMEGLFRVLGMGG